MKNYFETQYIVIKKMYIEFHKRLYIIYLFESNYYTFYLKEILEVL